MSALSVHFPLTSGYSPGLPLAVIANALEIYPALEYRAAFAELLT
jgi:hypothetical protein